MKKALLVSGTLWLVALSCSAFLSYGFWSTTMVIREVDE